MITRRHFVHASGALALAAVAQRVLRADHAESDASVSGRVVAATGEPVTNARITLFAPDLSFFGSLADGHIFYRECAGGLLTLGGR